jgi:hypothetical protein
MFDHLKNITRRGDDFVIMKLDGMPDFEKAFASVNHGDTVIACQKSKLKSNRHLSFCHGRKDKIHMRHLTNHIDKKLGLSIRGLHKGVSVSLKAKLNEKVEEQGPHCDFGPIGLNGDAAGAIIYAISEGVRLLVKCNGKKEEVVIPKGHCLIMDSQCVHAGPAYDGSMLVLRSHHEIYWSQRPKKLDLYTILHKKSWTD